MTAAVELLDLLEEKVCADARESILPFAVYTRPHYDPNWHHRVLCEKLDKFVRGEIKRLMVFMPPRHGKSELVSRCLPAFILGRNPDAQIIAISYAKDLASRMNRDVQRIMDSPLYRDVFSETRLNQSNIRTVAGQWMRNSDMFEVVGRNGSYRCAGVGGGVTGMGANYIIIDDPIKNAEQARSSTYRSGLWEYYASTLYTRAEGTDGTGDGSILLTVTRWNEADLAGQLLAVAEDPEADQWDVVCFPALSEDKLDPLDQRTGPGQALWPQRYPVDNLLRRKASMQSSYTWSALYQQRPTPQEGGLVKRDWIRYYTELPEGTTEWITSWDLNRKDTAKGSYAVGQIWCRKGGNFYLINQYRQRVDFPTVLAAFKKVVKDFPLATTHLVEDAANGSALIASVKDQIPGVLGVSVRGESKESRLSAVSHFLESGNVYFPSPQNEPWVADLVEEIVTFPNGATTDQGDSLSQALNRYKGSMPTNIKLDLTACVRPSNWVGSSNWSFQ